MAVSTLIEHLSNKGIGSMVVRMFQMRTCKIHRSLAYPFCDDCRFSYQRIIGKPGLSQIKCFRCKTAIEGYRTGILRWQEGRAAVQWSGYLCVALKLA